MLSVILIKCKQKVSIFFHWRNDVSLKYRFSSKQMFIVYRNRTMVESIFYIGRDIIYERRMNKHERRGLCTVLQFYVYKGHVSLRLIKDGFVLNYSNFIKRL